MSKKVMALAAFLGLIGGTVLPGIVIDENVYFCTNTNEICIGTHLSGGKHTRCYNQTGNWYDMPYCEDGWIEYDEDKIKRYRKGKGKYRCPAGGRGCFPI